MKYKIKITTATRLKILNSLFFTLSPPIYLVLNSNS